MNALDIVRHSVRIATDKRGEDLLVLKTRDVSSVADYFVLVTARNRRQMKAIAEQIKVDLKQLGERDLHAEGIGTDRWVLLDYGNVVVHVFDAETRAFYDLESLWADAPRIDVAELIRERDSA